MTHPSYALDVAHFETLLDKNEMNKTHFIARSGIPRRTFQNVLTGRHEITGSTIWYFLNTLPGSTFESLFRKQK